MNREQPHVFIHAFIHCAVELGKFGEVRTDLVLLVSCFLQKTLCHDETDILSSQEYLGETVLHAAQTVGDVLEAVAVKDGFLHTRHEAETQMLGDFTDFAQERQIQHEVMIFA